MKSKFTALIKIKEQKVEEVSIQLAEIRNAIVLKKNEIISLNNSFFNTKEPKSGTVAYFAQKQLLNIAHKQEQNLLESQLNSLTLKEEELVLNLKEEKLEFEKFNLLHKEELRKQLKIIKEKEAAFMDEMGSVGFNQNRSVI